MTRMPGRGTRSVNNLREALPPGRPYLYVIDATPDCEGAWFQETVAPHTLVDTDTAPWLDVSGKLRIAVVAAIESRLGSGKDTLSFGRLNGNGSRSG